ncbi:MAG TPA: prepilin-type N-terminal cleavage/methylation domain-containing protein, partial [Chloroflexota bacterium]|nr:prepilin-type N-terminal cleavage/methylation domain-containing protein [Chloroflexota bacterium]
MKAQRPHAAEQPRRGMTLVEMAVALGVACILMVAVVTFLVNGVVSTSKTTAIADTTTKGRYVFEHMSRELTRAADLTGANFTLPNGSNTAYSGFNYRINVTGSATTQQTLLSSQTLVVTVPVAAPPDYLLPQAGDYLLLPYPNLGSSGTLITNVSQSGQQFTLTLSDTLANLSGQSASNSVSNAEIATIQRQRSYTIDSVSGDTLLWYPATSTMPTTMIVAKSLPPNQFPFVPQPKFSGSNAVYVGVQLALSAPPSENVQILAGQSSFYRNNSMNAVFANKSGPSFNLVYLPT